jgi:hypothetical protein
LSRRSYPTFPRLYLLTGLNEGRSWIVKKILPYVPKTLLAHRLKRRTVGGYVNSVAEIEGALMKRGKDIMPYMALATSAKNMTEKQERQIIRKSVS